VQDIYKQKSGAAQQLDELDEKLARELYLADCPSVGPSERRVLVHATIFEAFMEKFKAYRPLLTKVKLEYDMVLHKYSNQLHILNAAQFKMSTESLIKSEEYLDTTNRATDEINALRAKLDALTKDKETEGQGIAQLQQMLEHWKTQASTRVPMVKLQMAETELAELKKLLEEEKGNHEETRKSVESHKDEIQKLKQEINRQKRVMNEMTPRPDWEDMLGLLTPTPPHCSALLTPTPPHCSALLTPSPPHCSALLTPMPPHCSALLTPTPLQVRYPNSGTSSPSVPTARTGLMKSPPC